MRSFIRLGAPDFRKFNYSSASTFFVTPSLLQLCHNGAFNFRHLPFWFSKEDTWYDRIAVAKIRSARDSPSSWTYPAAFRHLSSWPRYQSQAITGYLAMHTVFFPSLYGNARKRSFPARCLSARELQRTRRNRNRNTTVISDDNEPSIVSILAPFLK